MNARKFNLLCVSAIVVVAIFALVMLQFSPNGKSIQAPNGVDLGQLASTERTDNPFTIQPLSLPLALALVLDLGLMTLGLVILFHDEPISRHRVR